MKAKSCLGSTQLDGYSIDLWRPCTEQLLNKSEVFMENEAHSRVWTLRLQWVAVRIWRIHSKTSRWRMKFEKQLVGLLVLENPIPPTTLQYRLSEGNASRGRHCKSECSSLESQHCKTKTVLDQNEDRRHSISQVAYGRFLRSQLGTRQVRLALRIVE